MFQIELFKEFDQTHKNVEKRVDLGDLYKEITDFNLYGERTVVEERTYSHSFTVPVFINEFWTARQRQAHSLHEVSYRACFKPQLPRFFIERFSQAGENVYDPFMGRGTTLLEAALLNRVPYGCDINPLSEKLILPRLCPPTLAEVEDRLNSIDFSPLPITGEFEEDLLTFYHPETLGQIKALRTYLQNKEQDKIKSSSDNVDQWIRMVATNRLTGHSPGFFSVYTLPPNQACTVTNQKRINQSRNQTPPLRDVKKIILKKSKSLLADLKPESQLDLRKISKKARTFVESADSTPQIRSRSIALVVTSPPFLKVVQYERDNWLRCWFNNIDPSTVNLWQIRQVEQWANKMEDALSELRRILVPGGIVAFEVGEVECGDVLLEEYVIPAGIKAGLVPLFVLINDQEFTKTANCWGVGNNSFGTNTNRVVVLAKP